MISYVTRVFIIAFLAAGSAQAAALAPVTPPTIPFAFEENRGQAPEQYQHLLTHYGWAFSCDAIAHSQPQLGNPILSAFRFAGANAACQATLEQPTQSYSHYYRGTDPAQSQSFLQRFGLLTYKQVWPGVDVSYSGSGSATGKSGFWMKLQLDSPRRLDAVQLSSITYGSDSYSYAYGDGTTISSRLGVWTISAEQGGAPTAVQAANASDSRTILLQLPAAAPGLPATIWIQIPVDAAGVAGTYAEDTDGNGFYLATTDPYSRMDPNPFFCNPKTLAICTDVYVAGVTRSGELRSLTYFVGTYDDIPYWIRLDPGGNVYITGTTESSDFVGRAALGPTAAAPGSPDIFVMKIHGPTGALIQAVTLGGSGPDRPTAFEVDSNGHATLLVNSQSPDFPSASTPLFGTQCTPTSTHICPWVANVAVRAGELVYSFHIPGGIYRDPNVGLPLLAVDSPSGTAHLAVSGWIDIPVPPGAAHPTRTSQALVAISRDGRSFLNATYVPPGREINQLAAAGDQSLWLAGRETSSDLTTGPAFIAKLDASASQIQVVATPLPTTKIAAEAGGGLYVSLDSYLVNSTYPGAINLQPTPDAPLPNPCPRSGALLRLDASGAIDFATYLPSGSASLVTSGSGVVSLLPLYGPSVSSNWRFDPGAPSAPLLGCTFVPYAGSAFGADGRYGPGTVVVMLGKDIGPSTPVDMPLDSAGRVAREAGGVKVLVGGQAAPILAASQDRLTFVVPIGAPLGYVGVSVQKDGQTLGQQLPFLVETYGLEILGGPFAPPGIGIINEDGSVNSKDHPATVGSTIRFYISGAGPTDPPLEDGVLQHPNPEKPQVTLYVTVGGAAADLLSFAQATDLVSGIMEVRLRVPDSVGSAGAPVSLPIGTYFNLTGVYQTAEIWVVTP